RVIVLSLYLVPNRQDSKGNGSAKRIADPKLEGPTLRPGIALIILTHFDLNLVPALLERAAANVLVHALAVVVFLAEVDLLTVEKYLDRVIAAGAYLHRPRLARVYSRKCIRGGTMMLANGLVQINETARIGGRVRFPADLLILFAFVDSAQVHYLLG